MQGGRGWGEGGTGCAVQEGGQWGCKEEGGLGEHPVPSLMPETHSEPDQWQMRTSPWLVVT